ncbi:hypothetical protein [Candidatus Poriferisodalis sp.]|uniref:hypothetical protein n=1 Tax=Candidatus Poriferisodalis sp. TaxID=3101277 RepID=UPI003B01F770
MTETPPLRSELEQLVFGAFQIAAQQGNSDWFRMRGSVLKNRLLDLTGRSFNEQDYGADGFSALVEQLPNLLLVDHTAKPFLVELQEPFRSEIQLLCAVAEPSGDYRLRTDLWQAIVDYSGADPWVWDRKLDRAVTADGAVDPSDADRLPTLDRSTLQDWRREFVHEHSGSVIDHEAAAIEDWAREGLSTVALPKRLRRAWNARMRDRVRDRVLEFFDSHGLEPPPDLLTGQRSGQQADELRSFILRCIALMSEKELKDLTIPAEVAMRAHQ